MARARCPRPRILSCKLEPTRMAAGPPLDHPCYAATFIRQLIGEHAREQFVALYVSSAHCPIAYDTFTMGGINAVVSDPGAVLRGAVMSGAPFIITAHNHPSGDPSPSREDREFTRRPRYRR